MNDHLVRTFIAVYESGSMGEASKAIGQSKTNISKHIKSLEEELGIILFNRSSRGMVATEDGHKIYNVMKYLQFNINELERFYSLNKESTSLRVATNYIEEFAKYFAQVVENYGQDKALYTYRNTNSDDVLDLLIRDKCDVGILCFTESTKEVFIKLCETHKIYYKIIHQGKPTIYVRENHPLVSRDTISHMDLMPYKRVGLNDAERKIISYVPSMMKSKMQPTADISVTSVRSIAKFLQHSDYYYISVDPLNTRGFIKNIKVIPIKEHVDNMYFVWCFKKCYPLNKEGSHFINLVESFFKGEKK